MCHICITAICYAAIKEDNVRKSLSSYIDICRIIENCTQEWIQSDYILTKIAIYSKYMERNSPQRQAVALCSNTFYH